MYLARLSIDNQTGLGTFCISKVVGEPVDKTPSFSIDIVVSADTHEALRRIFADALANYNGSLSIEIMLRHRKGSKPEFWRTGWHDERLEICELFINTVSHFRRTTGIVYSSANGEMPIVTGKDRFVSVYIIAVQFLAFMGFIKCLEWLFGR